MSILYGLYHPDEGEIRLNGKLLCASTRPATAIDSGIGMVHQHFMLIPVMTVAENIVLGVEPTSGPFLDLDAAEERVRELSEQFGLAVRPEARIDSISRRHAAAGRDPEGALPGGGNPHPRRAHGGPHAAGGGASCSRSSARSRPRGSRSSSSATSSTRCSQIADRITVLRRGKTDRDGSARRGHPGGPRPADGRARGGPPRGEAAGRAGRALLAVEDLVVARRRVASRPCAASRSRCVPARSSASPAWTGTASPS